MWSVSKALQIPLDPRVKRLFDLPHTISYVIRKRQQIDGFRELPKEKRPPEILIWEGTIEELDEWLERVFDTKTPNESILTIDDIEG